MCIIKDTYYYYYEVTVSGTYQIKHDCSVFALVLSADVAVSNSGAWCASISVRV